VSSLLRARPLGCSSQLKGTETTYTHLKAHHTNEFAEGVALEEERKSRHTIASRTFHFVEAEAVDHSNLPEVVSIPHCKRHSCFDAQTGDLSKAACLS